MDIFCDKHVQIKVTEATENRFLKKMCVQQSHRILQCLEKGHFVDEDLV